jgi:hypothetical protein
MGASHGVSHEPDCAAHGDVVGFPRCTRFGEWGMNPAIPPILVEAGVVIRQFASLLDGQLGRVQHGDEVFAYRASVATRGAQLDTAVLSTIRAGVGLPHGFYAAAEVDLGGLTQVGAATTEMMSTGTLGTPALQQDRGFVVDSLGTIGLHGTSHTGGLGVELSGGLRAVSYSFESHYVSCVQSTSITAYAPIAEARVRGELWVTPWLTAGVTAGTSVIAQHAWMGGLYLGVHTRAFGGLP